MTKPLREILYWYQKVLSIFVVSSTVGYTVIVCTNHWSWVCKYRQADMSGIGVHLNLKVSFVAVFCCKIKFIVSVNKRSDKRMTASPQNPLGFLTLRSDVLLKSKGTVTSNSIQCVVTRWRFHGTWLPRTHVSMQTNYWAFEF